jgi:hypothetical protein
MEAVLLSNLENLPRDFLLIGIIVIMLWAQRRRDAQNDERFKSAQQQFIAVIERRDATVERVTERFITLQQDTNRLTSEQSALLRESVRMAGEHTETQRGTTQALKSLTDTVTEAGLRHDSEYIELRKGIDAILQDMTHVRSVAEEGSTSRERFRVLQQTAVRTFRQIVKVVQQIEQIAPRAQALEASTLVLQQATSLHHAILDRLSNIERKLSHDEIEVSDDVGAADVGAADADPQPGDGAGIDARPADKPPADHPSDNVGLT